MAPLNQRRVIDWHPQIGLAPADATALDDVQATILRPHAQPRAALVLLRFTDVRLGRRWLANLAPSITSTTDQLRAAGHRFTGGITQGVIPGAYGSDESVAERGVVVTIALSKAGYDALGITATPDEALAPAQQAFSTGMQARGGDLGDPDPDEWDEPYRDGELHAVLQIAGDGADVVDGLMRSLLASGPQDGIDVIGIERGAMLWNQAGQSIEHFGFVDGRSLPRFLSYDAFTDAQRNSATYWPSSAPLESVLVPDPLRSGQAFGSYLVLRKLEQNVRGFKKAVGALARSLRVDEEEAGAQLVGRRPDGTPLHTGFVAAVAGAIGAPAPPERLGLAVDNGFLYLDNACPVSAHTRLMNPRTADSPYPLARRSIPYGRRIVHPDDAIGDQDFPLDGVGLLFMANVADIETQFETLQKAANGAGPGTFDAIIGQGTPSKVGFVAGGKTTEEGIGGFVTLKGGAYLFMPSISGLASLA